MEFLPDGGHSYGADTAAVVANSYEGKIDTLVGVDPVSQPGWDVTGRNGTPDNVGTVVSVNASGPSMTRNEAIEGVGKAFGGGVPGTYRQPDVSISTSADHAAFRGIYNAPGEDGRSARAIVDETYRRRPE